MDYDFFIFHGHGDGDNGACANGYTELNIAQSIQRSVLNELDKYNLKIHSNNGENNYYKNLTFGNSYKERFGFIIHINSGGGTGAEMIVPLGESYFIMENNILNKLEKLGLKNRGVKSRDYTSEKFISRYHMVKGSGTDWYKEIRDCWVRGNSATILEIGFIDNIHDLEILNNNINKIGNIIATEIINYLNIKELKVCPTCGK